MKLEDEILKVLNIAQTLNAFPNIKAVIVAGIKSLIERYCKRQREICANTINERPFLNEEEKAEVYYHVSKAKLATEE